MLFFKLICIDVCDTQKKVTLRVRSLIGNLDFQIKLVFFLLFSHSGVSHPAWHPPSHNPVIQSHFPGTLQFSLHLFSQYGPNHPNLHSVKMDFSQNRIYTFCKKNRISHFISIEILNTNTFLYLINLNIVRKHKLLFIDICIYQDLLKTNKGYDMQSFSDFIFYNYSTILSAIVYHTLELHKDR